MLMWLISLVFSCAEASNSTLLDEAGVAFTTWATNSGTPYRNEKLEIKSNDDTFAEVEVIAELRLSSDSEWLEHIGTINCTKVSNEWQCESSMQPTLTESARAIVLEATRQVRENILFVGESPSDRSVGQQCYPVSVEFIWNDDYTHLDVNYDITLSIKNTDSVDHTV